METPSGWNGPATCLPEACFCEQVTHGAIRQPANTVSSLGFVGVGLVLLVLRRRSMARRVQVGYCLSLIAIGLASAAFHASLRFWGQWCDVSSMYAFAALISCIHLGELKLLTRRGQTLAFLLITSASSIAGALYPSGRRWVFDLLLLLALSTLLRLAFTRWRAVSKRNLVAAVTALLFAVAAWIADLRELWCDPTSLLQGHSVWHLLAATATACLFFYYRAGYAHFAGAAHDGY